MYLDRKCYLLVFCELFFGPDTLHITHYTLYIILYPHKVKNMKTALIPTWASVY